MNVSNLKYTGERCIPEKMAKNIKIYQHHLARYNFALMYARDKNVVDAACGCGFGTALMADVAKTVIGLDNSPEAIQYAQEKYAKSNVIYKLTELDIEPITSKFSKNSVDIVISFETIEHLKQPEFFINEVAKSGVPEFLFSIPIGAENEFHKQIFTVEQVKSFMNEYFKDITWCSQRGLNIYKGSDKSKYLIGYAKQ
jgi:2-polyprenyl-3-methyl-5-hydroxy-6-metoxy-1,4-benzoquinol methylase